MKSLLFAIMAMLICIGCNAAEEIEVSLQKDPHSHYGGSLIIVQAVDDSVTVKDIVLNRGNCAVNYSYDYSTKKFAKQKTLKYGETFTPSTLCKLNTIREVQVTTASGTYAFKL